MAYAFRAASTNGNASGAALTVTKPTGTADGDLLIAVGYLEPDTGAWSSVGAGFTSAGATWVNTGLFVLQTWWKIAAGEPASWTWTPAASGWRTVHVAAFTGATGAGTNRVDVYGAAAQADGALTTAQTAPSVIPTATGDLLTFVYGNFSGTAAGPLIGAANATAANLGGLTLGYAALTTTAATGTTYPNDTGTQDYAARHVAYLLSTAVAPNAPVAGEALNPTESTFWAQWADGGGDPTAYRLDVAGDSGFTSYVSGYQDLDVGLATQWPVEGLAASATYSYRVRAVNAVGVSGNSATVAATTTAAVASGTGADRARAAGPLYRR